MGERERARARAYFDHGLYSATGLAPRSCTRARKAGGLGALVGELRGRDSGELGGTVYAPVPAAA